MIRHTAIIAALALAAALPVTASAGQRLEEARDVGAAAAASQANPPSAELRQVNYGTSGVRSVEARMAPKPGGASYVRVPHHQN